jgi:beta-glucosidase
VSTRCLIFVNHPNVSAIIYHYYPGQEGGKALADVLYGDEAPSGRLPFTIARDVKDYDLSSYFNLTGSENIQEPSAVFSSESLTDYRFFDYNKVEPLYEFGFGLPYTKFEFTNLKVNKKAAKHTPLVVKTNEVLLDSDLDLYDQAIELAVEVKHTGSVNAKEVVQVYVSYPDSGTNKRPTKNLRGFEKVDVKAGGKTKVTAALNNKDLAVWNTERQGWEILKGTYALSVGSSSRKLPLTATVSY